MEIGLNNQRIVVHQLYNLVIITSQTQEELEGSLQILVQEEEREILQRQRREEQQDQRDQRLARATQEQGQD